MLTKRRDGSASLPTLSLLLTNQNLVPTPKPGLTSGRRAPSLLYLSIYLSLRIYRSIYPPAYLSIHLSGDFYPCPRSSKRLTNRKAALTKDRSERRERGRGKKEGGREGGGVGGGGRTLRLTNDNNSRVLGPGGL